MKAKNKNPLYVVKEGHVEAADGVFDLLIKKFNLEPIFEMISNLLNMLLEYVNSYSTFMVVKNLLDEFMRRLEMFKRFAII